MANFVLDFLASLFKNEETLMIYLSYMFIVCGLLTVLTLWLVTAPYGRYSRSGWGILVPSTTAWLLQELPCLLVPLMLVLFSDCPRSIYYTNRFVLGLFLLHYCQRALIFPFLIRGGKPTPVSVFLMAAGFCIVNGYLQTGLHPEICRFDMDTPDLLTLNLFFYFQNLLGVLLFLSGMIINLHSDSVLRNLRKPGESGYKIPYGGMFNYVSGANFLGEILEWWGFAILSWNLPALAFAIFTLCNIGPRKFDDYPASRKALIPFLL
ncbi:unnamed protein product [Candidula unifasciata]|uniref:3-oxo-5-alpha-steroid 4-dehydrogenase C-terminal domain-containing protein n=1 Tax=Candidula unifasciata TaxID=100452 RepID=A0A8S4A829_9EUPU|nr:unnamed protein product [Candidula unifasciata]